MFFYRYFAGFGRDDLADAFITADPFSLPPAEIVERVLAQGLGPELVEHRTQMWPTIGHVFEVQRDEQDFIVAVSRDAQEISVQEIRADPYLPIE